MNISRPNALPPITHLPGEEPLSHGTSVATPPSAPAAPPHTSAEEIPTSLSMNGRTVRIGSFSTLKDRTMKRLLAAAMRPQGEVQESATDVIGETEYHYKAQARSGENGQDPEAKDTHMDVKAWVDGNGNLKRLQASNTSNPESNNAKGLVLDQEFYARQPTSFSRLPNELLHEINDLLPKNDRLNMRGTSQHLKAVAEDKLSAETNFIIRYGQELKDAGFHDYQIREVASKPEAEREFVGNHIKAFAEAGLVWADILSLPHRPESHLDVVLQHGPELKHMGFDGHQIVRLAGLDPRQLKFAMDNAGALRMRHYSGDFICALAATTTDQRVLYAANAQSFVDARFDSDDILRLITSPKNTSDFVIQHLPALTEMGLSHRNMITLGNCSAEERDFVFKHGSKLIADGISPSEVVKLSSGPSFLQDMVRHNARTLSNAGFTSGDIMRLFLSRDYRPAEAQADLDKQMNFYSKHGAALHQSGFTTGDLQGLAQSSTPEDQLDFISNNAATLKKYGLETHQIIERAKLPPRERDAFINSIQKQLNAVPAGGSMPPHNSMLSAAATVAAQPAKPMATRIGSFLGRQLVRLVRRAQR